MKKYVAICFLFLFGNEIISGIALALLVWVGMFDFFKAVEREARQRYDADE